MIWQSLKKPDFTQHEHILVYLQTEKKFKTKCQLQPIERYKEKEKENNENNSKQKMKNLHQI